MFLDNDPRGYFQKSALEIAAEGRERERQLAILQLEEKAAVEKRPVRWTTFLSALLLGLK